MRPTVLILGYLLTGCASIRNEHVGTVVSKDVGSPVSASPIVISATLVEKLSSEYFGYFDFTIENYSENWIEVKIASIEFGNGGLSDKIKYITGPDFDNWRTAMSHIIKVEEFNRTSAAAIVGGIGLGLAATTENKALQSLGGSAAAGSAAFVLGKEIGAGIDSLERSKMSLENHLVNDSSLVLPGLFVKKWLLVNSSKHDQTGYLSKMAIRYTVNGVEEVAEIAFRDPNSAFPSRWQSKKKPTMVRTNLSDYQRR